jgi:hypothetical protein
MSKNTGNLRIDFSLKCLSRKDEEAGVMVGYIPSLRLYSQGRTDEELNDALCSAAEQFIVVCYEREILGKVLRDRGMTKAAGQHAIKRAEEFITVSEYESSYEKEFTVKVPIDLLAAQHLQLAAA